MIDRRRFRRLRPRVGLPPILALSCLAVYVGSGAAAVTKRAHRQPAVASSKKVLACLHKVHLKDVTASSKSLWVAWEPAVGGFVYVQKYRTSKSALAAARFLRDEESGLSTRLVISQHIAPYPASPVPSVVKCLGGRMISGKPKPGTGYKF
jgi:hypothetical protein